MQLHIIHLKHRLDRRDQVSCVLNVNRFIKKYAGSGDPKFIEGNIFKMIILVGEGLNEGLKSLLATVIKNSGVQAKRLTGFTGK